MKRRIIAFWAIVLVAMPVLAACGSDSKTQSVPATNGVTVQAGINDPKDPTIAVLEFMPAAVTVAVGTPVTWSWTGASEPHSVSLFPPGQQPPAPDQAEPLFAPTPPTGPYDGTTFVNSGLQPLGPAPAPPMTMTFSKPGTYSIYCIIHPQMVGTVTVADTGTDSADAVKARGDAELAKWLEEGRAAKAKLVGAPPAHTANADGTTTWEVQTGVTTPHTDVLAFGSLDKVKTGDEVRFLNQSGAPHTATFFNETPPIQNPVDPKVAMASPGPSPQILITNGLFNTGTLPPDAPPGQGPPEAARSFTFKTKTAGSYPYVCVLHAPSSMASSFTVV
jgi:plastocyanin